MANSDNFYPDSLTDWVSMNIFVAGMSAQALFGYLRVLKEDT